MNAKRIYSIVFSALLIFGGGSNVHASESKSIEDKYIYPIQVGTEEWNQIDSSEEKRILSNIPNEVVDNMTTTALLESILDYPLLADIFAFNTISEGIEVTSDRFYALESLLRREDATDVIHDAFMMPVQYSTEETVFNDMILESLLSFKDFNAELNQNQLEDIIEKVDQQDYTVYYIGLQEQIDMMDMQGSVKTPNGTSVPVTIATYELSALEIQNLNKKIESSYPNATRKVSASRKYNCHSYAWYSQTTLSNNVWINGIFASSYMSDGSYRRVSSSTNNARIFYPNGDHSGIISSGRVTSKWGTYGVYSHTVADSPYNSSGVTYWVR